MSETRCCVFHRLSSPYSRVSRLLRLSVRGALGVACLLCLYPHITNAQDSSAEAVEGPTTSTSDQAKTPEKAPKKTVKRRVSKAPTERPQAKREKPKRRPVEARSAKRAQRPKQASTPVPKPVENTDDLWAAESSEGIGSAGLPDLSQTSGKPQFNWDQHERKSDSDKIFIEHHGYFRFRADLLHNFDLGTYDAANLLGTSQYLPPLTDRAGSNRKESNSLSSANIRFRYSPTLHVTEQMRVYATLDLPDNLVLGSTPDGGPLSINQRPDALFDGLSGTQTPLDDALRIRHVWGVWENSFMRLDFGRMRHHWGLGIFANSGMCLDCDFGDSVDRVQVTTELLDIYLTLSWDFVAEGPIGYGVIDQVMGQRWDWDQRDDVDQYSLSIGQRPISRADYAEQRERLNRGDSVVEWGLYAIMRTQQNAGAYLDLSSAQASPETPDPAEGGYTLYPARLQLVTPDLYLSWKRRPTPKSEYSFRLEAVAQIGEVQHVPLSTFAVQGSTACRDNTVSLDQCPTSQTYSPLERTISTWGYALEFDAREGNVLFGLHHGGASGDDNSGYFGGRSYLSQGALADPTAYDPDLNGFRFDRDYIIDLILFREVLGGVHNALYFKPYVAYEIPQAMDTVWGFKLAAIYGMAVNPEYTAGQESGLGLEGDLEAYIYQKNRFRFSAAYGIMMPFGGLNLRVGNNIVRQASLAQTFQLNLGLMF